MNHLFIKLSVVLGSIEDRIDFTLANVVCFYCIYRNSIKQKHNSLLSENIIICSFSTKRAAIKKQEEFRKHNKTKSKLAKEQKKPKITKFPKNTTNQNSKEQNKKFKTTEQALPSELLLLVERKRDIRLRLRVAISRPLRKATKS